jgi:hypothetical protein
VTWSAGGASCRPLGTEACRSYGCDVGHGATVACFGYHGHQVDHCATPAGTLDTRAGPCDPVSLPRPDEAALHRLHQSRLAHGCAGTAIVDHGLMRSLFVPGPSQVRSACLPGVLCHGWGGVHQGQGTPERIASVGGNE